MASDSLINLLPVSHAVPGELPADTVSASPSSHPSASSGGHFANLLQGIRSPSGGNSSPGNVALSGKDLPPEFLTKFNQLDVSSQVQIITLNLPPPDNQSLMSFARAQGIDESILQRLLNPQGIAIPADATVDTSLAAAAQASAAPPSATAALAGPADALPDPPVFPTGGLRMGSTSTRTGRLDTPSDDADARTASDADLQAAGAMVVTLSGLLTHPATTSTGGLASSPTANALSSASPDSAQAPSPVPVAPAGVAAQPAPPALPGDARARPFDALRAGAVPMASDASKDPQHGAHPASRGLMLAPGLPGTPAVSPGNVPMQGTLSSPATPQAAGEVTALAGLRALTGLRVMSDVPAAPPSPPGFDPTAVRAMRPAWAAPARVGQNQTAAQVRAAMMPPAPFPGAAGGQSPRAPLTSLTPLTGLTTVIPPGASIGDDSAITPIAVADTATPVIPEGGPTWPQTASYDLPDPVPARPAPGASATTGPGERYQAVAHQMAEAVARQINAAIDNGHWRVEMHLNPPNMGQIDVTLTNAANGALDAQFNASQSHTRQLLTDALPHLKETLAGAGIAPGQMEVNPGQASTSEGSSYNTRPDLQQSFNQNARQDAGGQEGLVAMTDDAPAEDDPAGRTSLGTVSRGLLDVLA